MNLAPLLLCGLAGVASALTPDPLSSTSSQPAPRSIAQDGLFPTAQDNLFIEVGPEQSPTLYDVVLAYGEATGQAFLLSPETTSLLKGTHTGLTRSLQVPPDRLQAIFEQFLIASDMVLSIRHAEEPRLLSIVSLNGPRRAGVRAHTFEVDVQDIDVWDDHAAVLVSTVVNLPNTDVRQLSNSLRTMITDANTQQILPAGNSHNLVLTGFGSDVAALVRMMQRVDAASRIEAPSTEEPELRVVVLKHTNAHQLASTLRELVSHASGPVQVAGNAPGVQAAQAPESPRIVADSHNNALLLQATSDSMEELMNLVALLDRPVEPGEDK